jgi:hypothetical protein
MRSSTHGANAIAQSNDGTTPLHQAFEQGHSDGDSFWTVYEDVVHVHPNCAEPDPLMGESESDDEEPFHAETRCAEDEDEGAFDWAGFDDRLVKEGEEWDADEETGAVTTTLVEDAPHIESRPVPHNVLHAPVSHTPAAPGAPDEEEACLRIVSSRGEPITDKLGQMLLERARVMWHAFWLPKPPGGCNVRAHNPDGSKPDTCMCEGWRLSSDINVRAHPTVEQDVQVASAAQLEGRNRGGWPRASRLLCRRPPQHFSIHHRCPPHLPIWKSQPSHAEARAPTSPRASSTALSQEERCTQAPMPLASRPACKSLVPSRKTQMKQGE